MEDIAKQIGGTYKYLNAIENLDSEFILTIMIGSLLGNLIFMLLMVLCLILGIDELKATRADNIFYVLFFTTIFTIIGVCVAELAYTTTPLEIISGVKEQHNTPEIIATLRQEGFEWERTWEETWEKSYADYVLTPEEEKYIKNKTKKTYKVLFSTWVIIMLLRVLYILRHHPHNHMTMKLVRLLPREKQLQWKRKNRFGLNEEEEVELFQLINQKLLKHKKHALYIERIINAWTSYSRRGYYFNESDIEFTSMEFDKEYNTHENIVATKHLVSFQVIESLLSKPLNHENKDKINKIIELYEKDIKNVKSELDNLESEVTKVGQDRISELLEHEIKSFER